MSTLGTYSFLPWLRQGLANQIASADNDPAVKLRPSVTVELALDGDKVGGGSAHASVSKPVALYGPGDVIGIDSRAIVRTEPRNWITNFEPNYLAHIEFYDEDFPWRYTPAAPDVGAGRLRPWLTLIVLTEAEFRDATGVKDRPLPAIEVSNLDLLPNPAELWAWAHVHVNRDLGKDHAEFVSGDGAAVAGRLAAVLAENPDLAYSRLVCPRRLAADTAYHAFVIPTFEVGRRAGLGLDLADTPATRSAWDKVAAGPEPSSMPVYYRWFFHTGANGDFETLVRLLRPLAVNPKVGTREMDTQFPGSHVTGVDNPDLHGILMLGGALRPPSKVPPDPPTVFEKWDDQPARPYPRPLQEDLARLVNLPDDRQRAGDPDPVITPPLYGRWHAIVSRVLRDAGGALIHPLETWVHRLNVDPRFRVAAGFGTRVVQDQQEKYMDAAWEQVGAVLEAQRRIRFGQFGLRVSQAWYERHVQALGMQRLLSMVAPLNRRILASGYTLRHTMAGATVQPTMTSAVLRRQIRPRGRLMRALPFDAAHPSAALLDRVNRGEVSAAPPKVAPPGVTTTDEVADRIGPHGVPGWLLNLIRRYPSAPLWTLLLGLVIAVVVLLALLFVAPVVAIAVAVLVAAAGVALSQAMRRWRVALSRSAAVRDDQQTVAAVDALPGAAGYAVAELGAAVTVHTGPDSPQAARLKQALRESFALHEAAVDAGAPPARARLDLPALAAIALASLRPEQTVRRRVMAQISLPARVRAEIGPDFVEPMAYPVIDLPMYEPLKNLGTELFLPNVNLIENNTVTLLEVNQRFIESYMVGINHEFARELLWREYPTDQRGTPFRQFWDVRGFFDPSGLAPEALREKLRDIPPLHHWAVTSALGTHDNRETGGEQEDELVLVIRGELLKRYPTAVIYAHRAAWQLKDGKIDKTRERRFVELTGPEEEKPPRDKVLTPLYEAKIDPDIYLFGFDLTAAKAKGETPDKPDDPGWFFVIKERPGEPRLGLDTDKQPTLQTWNDLSWPDLPAVAPGANLAIATSPASFTLHDPTGTDSEKKPQHDDDVHVAWSHAMHAATLAYILFQVPVLVGVHASEMLPG